jgi:hypothetical protein
LKQLVLERVTCLDGAVEDHDRGRFEASFAV